MDAERKSNLRGVDVMKNRRVQRGVKKKERERSRGAEKKRKSKQEKRKTFLEKDKRNKVTPVKKKKKL